MCDDFDFLVLFVVTELWWMFWLPLICCLFRFFIVWLDFLKVLIKKRKWLMLNKFFSRFELETLLKECSYSSIKFSKWHQLNKNHIKSNSQFPTIILLNFISSKKLFKLTTKKPQIFPVFSSHLLSIFVVFDNLWSKIKN